jgi:hypothetical protein
MEEEIEFDSILNFRDVGVTINEFLGGKYVTAPGRIIGTAY